MKKIAIAISALTFVFAVSTTVIAQEVPAKKATECATVKKDGKCATEKSAEAKKGCATPCTTEQAKACCAGDKAKTAKPVPAPESK
ncbi:MAG: hypothetical protein K0B15_12755 [Lentimicrobium sp.]|nr:hypothetical protein [Lentimicrobium sp.]